MARDCRRSRRPSSYRPFRPSEQPTPVSSRPPPPSPPVPPSFALIHLLAALVARRPALPRLPRRRRAATRRLGHAHRLINSCRAATRRPTRHPRTPACHRTIGPPERDDQSESRRESGPAQRQQHHAGPPPPPPAPRRVSGGGGEDPRRHVAHLCSRGQTRTREQAQMQRGEQKDTPPWLPLCLDSLPVASPPPAGEAALTRPRANPSAASTAATPDKALVPISLPPPRRPS